MRCRRLHQQDSSQEKGHNLIPTKPNYNLNLPAEIIRGEQTSTQIRDSYIYHDSGKGPLVSLEVDHKYRKNWNLRSLSNRVQLASGNALRSFIQQPLSAAAAIVTDNHLNDGKLNQQSFSNQIGEEFELDQYSVVVMASRDRTTEFTNAIRSLQSRNITRAVNIKDPRKVKSVQSYSEFMMVAIYVGKGIASTYAKLERLTLFAKKKSIFDDRPKEIQELTYIIKGDLNAINQQIARLQEISREQRRNVNGKHLISHSSNMVLALQSKLASMSTDFKQILEVRTENLREQKSRQDQFIQGPVSVNLVSQPTTKQSSLLLNDGNTVKIDMSKGDTTSLLGAPTQIQTQSQIQLYAESDNFVQQRAETMQNIESTIVELGGIFQQLAYMVKEQEEIVERIDTNVQDAELNIEAAHREILRYFQSISKNRWLMIKIFGVLILFFILFIVSMA